MTIDFVDISLNIFEELPEDVVVTDELLAFAQEIWLIFNMKQYEYIADTKSGALSIESLLFNRTVDSQYLKGLVRDQIDNYTSGSAEFNYEVDVKFVQGTERDIIVIDTTILDNNDTPFKQRFIFK